MKKSKISPKNINKKIISHQINCKHKFLLTPELPYEEVGFVPNVVLLCATLQNAKTGHIAIYYGAADSYVALAFTEVNEVVKFIKNNHENVGKDGIK